jgi:hypothetical protein
VLLDGVILPSPTLTAWISTLSSVCMMAAALWHPLCGQAWLLKLMLRRLLRSDWTPGNLKGVGVYGTLARARAVAYA